MSFEKLEVDRTIHSLTISARGRYALYMRATSKASTSENERTRLAADEKVGPHGMTF